MDTSQCGCSLAFEHASNNSRGRCLHELLHPAVLCVDLTRLVTRARRRHQRLHKLLSSLTVSSSAHDIVFTAFLVWHVQACTHEVHCNWSFRPLSVPLTVGFQMNHVRGLGVGLMHL